MIDGACYEDHTMRQDSVQNDPIDSLTGWIGSSLNAWAYGYHPVGTGGWDIVADGFEMIDDALLDLFFGEDEIHNGLWSEFTADGKGGYNWIIHAGAGAAQQVNGVWVTVLKSVSASEGNSSFDLTPDTSGCNSINSTLPSHPSTGLPSYPGGNWQYNSCVATGLDGVTLTANCSNNVSSLNTSICADPTNVTTSMNAAGLACGEVVAQGTSAQVYNNNINLLIQKMAGLGIFDIATNQNGACEIIGVTDNQAAALSPTVTGITNITAQCLTQRFGVNESNVTVVTTSIEPQSCLDSSGNYDIINLNGSLVCDNPSGSGITVVGNSYGATITNFGESVISAAVPISDSNLLTKVLGNMPNWLDTELNAVNNVSFVNYPQVCTGGQVEFDPNTQNLRCVSYQSDVDAIRNANYALFDVYGNSTGNSCNIIGAERDESGILANIEYNCSYSGNQYSATGFYSYVGFINPQSCYNNIMIESAATGKLSCEYSAPQSTMPSGTWENSCQTSTATYNNGILAATCNPPNSVTPIQSTLQYAHVCASDATVSNINGYLSCDSYGSWWNSSLNNQASFSNNSWLSADNSSCIIQDIVPEGDFDLANYACQYSDGTYRVANGLLTCSNQLSNSNGVLACSTTVSNTKSILGG